MKGTFALNYYFDYYFSNSFFDASFCKSFYFYSINSFFIIC